MKKDNLSGNAKIALIRSKVIFCAAVLSLVASFQISIMSRPAHAIKQYSQANGNIACSSCHSRSGLANGTMYPLTGTGTYFKTNGVLPSRPAPQPVAPRPVAPPVYPPRQPVYPPYNPPQWRNPQSPVYPQQPVYPRPTVSLAYPLQSELKRLGCLPGRVDGIWGRGSRAALRRFANQARLRLGSEPSQNALDVARRSPTGFCPPVRRVYTRPYTPPYTRPYTPPYNPPRINPRPRPQPVTQACPNVNRLANVIRGQGFGNVQWKDCDLQQRYTFFALQGGNRWRLRIRSNGIIYKKQLR